MNYYYFAASLPALALDAPPPLRQDEFLARCQEHLRPADFDLLRQLLGLSATRSANAFLRAWQQHEVCLRNALARVRAARLGRDPAPHLRAQADPDPGVERVATDALAFPAPLERELALDRLRWAQAERLAGYNPFSIESILAYALKLMLATRWATLDVQAGREVASALIAQPVPAAVG